MNMNDTTLGSQTIHQRALIIYLSDSLSALSDSSIYVGALPEVNSDA